MHVRRSRHQSTEKSTTSIKENSSQHKKSSLFNSGNASDDNLIRSTRRSSRTASNIENEEDDENRGAQLTSNRSIIKGRSRTSSFTDANLSNEGSSDASASDQDSESDRHGDSECEDSEADSIEKILGRRFVQDDQPPSNTSKRRSSVVEQFLVKYKGYSYLHCEWRDRGDLETSDLNSKRLLRFLQQDETTVNEECLDNDEEDRSAVIGAGRYFLSDYCRIDRVVSHRMISSLKRSLKLSDLRSGRHWDKCEFMIRWMQQGYEECTWEEWSSLQVLPEEEIKAEITRYFRFCEPTEPPARTKQKENHARKRQSSKSSAAAWKVQPFPVLKFNDGLSLRDYQIDGVKWMSFNWSQHRNSILADEMGLGKTVQISAFIAHLAVNEGVQGPFLVVAPLSTLQHWRRESEAWAPSLNCVVYHGGVAARDIIREYEFKYDKKFPNKPYKFDIFVTSYEMILADAKIMSRIKWDLLVVDESHRLKNRESKLFKELVRFQTKHCIMLTGTPVQNSIDELWVLLHFLDPDAFDSMDAFQAKFGDLKHKEDVDGLHSLLKPYFLRRMKSDVEKDLPDRQEIIIDVEMTMLQKRLYKAIYEKNTEFLFKKSSVPSLLNVAMQLRKCCNHPYLIRGVEDDEQSAGLSDEAKMGLLVGASGKFVLLDKLLPKLKSEGHRVLIFSQMVRMLDIIEDYLNHREYEYERIDGNIRGSDRQQAIDNFSKNPEIFIFMLATRAGGVGINLTAADTVIIFDSDWNPQNDLQAQARCHRIGQTQHVKVYRLITKNTYEMAMFNRASLKLGLDQAVLHPMTTSTRGGSEKLSKKEVESLLKNGAYSIIEDKSDEKSKEFCEKDIDDILASSSRLIQYSSTPSMVGSSFAKASFVITSEAGEEALDIDDPDFWQKVGFHYEPAEKGNDLIIFETRKRRRVQRFVGYSGLALDNEHKDGTYSQEDSEDSGSNADGEPEVNDKKIGAKSELVPEHVEEGDWSVEDRERFICALSLFGYGRWEAIKKSILTIEEKRVPNKPISERTDDDLRLAAFCMLARCMISEASHQASVRRQAQCPIRNLLTCPTLAEDLQKLLNSQGAEWDLPNRALKIAEQRQQMELGFASLTVLPSFKSVQFNQLLSKRARAFLHQIERCYVLNFSVEKVCGSDMNFSQLAECAHFNVIIVPPIPSWTLADDAALLQGSYLFGQGHFDAINQYPESCLYRRLRHDPNIVQAAGTVETENPVLEADAELHHLQESEANDPGAVSTTSIPSPDVSQFPTAKSLNVRLRSLLTNLGKQAFKIASRPIPVHKPRQVPASAPAPSTAAVATPPQPGVLSNAPDEPYNYGSVESNSTFDPSSAAAQALQPTQYPYFAGSSGASKSFKGYESYVSGQSVPPPLSNQYAQFYYDPSALAPLQFVAEYRSLSATSEELMQSYPVALMDVLHKSHYLNAEFERKEEESRSLSSSFPMLKGPVDALGDNARDLAILFRRVRRRTNKILHVQQIVAKWATTQGFNHEGRQIPADAILPAEISEKKVVETDLLNRVSECLASVGRLHNRNRLILSRLEHLASSRD